MVMAAAPAAAADFTLTADRIATWLASLGQHSSD
jgi:hypothetical protein